MKNWRTTLAGILTGAIPILQAAYDTLAHNQPVNWMLVGFGIAIMILGVVISIVLPPG